MTFLIPLHWWVWDSLPCFWTLLTTHLQAEKCLCSPPVTGEQFLPPHNAAVCIFADVFPQKHAGMNHYWNNLLPVSAWMPSHDALMLCLSSYKNYLWPKCDLLNQNTYSWNQSSSMLMQVETLMIFQSHVEYSKAGTEGKELTLINIWSCKIKATVKLILQDN